MALSFSVFPFCLTEALFSDPYVSISHQFPIPVFRSWLGYFSVTSAWWGTAANYRGFDLRIQWKFTYVYISELQIYCPLQLWPMG